MKSAFRKMMVLSALLLTLCLAGLAGTAKATDWLAGHPCNAAHAGDSIWVWGLGEVECQGYWDYYFVGGNVWWYIDYRWEQV